MVRSQLPDASNAPSGEKATLVTQSVCPLRVRTRAPSDTRHIRMMPFPPPDTSNLPSGEKAMLETALKFERVRTNAPSDMRHNLTEPSELPDASHAPSGEKATLETALLCPPRIHTMSGRPCA
jgi:hypothetical protein